MRNFYRFLSTKIAFSLAVVLFLACSYWIYKNINLTDLTGIQTNESKPKFTQTPNSVAKILNLEIRNGDIVSVLSPDLVKLVVGHLNLDGVERIISLSFSEKAGKMCFIAETLTPEWMYISNTDGSGLKKVALASKCKISPDGNYISYINQVTDVSRTDVYLYSFASAEITNLTKSSSMVGYQRNYSEIKWTGDSTIEAPYKDWLIKNYLTGVDGVSVINIFTGSVSEK